MSGSNSAERKRHEPLVLVETADLSEEEWLDYRRRGIGGSDVSAIFGTSPFRTARDLYYDKLNIASVEDDEGNWVAMEMGHLLEPLVAKIFERKTGYRVYQIKKMFQHPQYPWMLADVDYFVELPDGTTAMEAVICCGGCNMKRASAGKSRIMSFCGCVSRILSLGMSSSLLTA